MKSSHYLSTSRFQRTFKPQIDSRGHRYRLFIEGLSKLCKLDLGTAASSRLVPWPMDDPELQRLSEGVPKPCCWPWWPSRYSQTASLESHHKSKSTKCSGLHQGAEACGGGRRAEKDEKERRKECCGDLLQVSTYSTTIALASHRHLGVAHAPTTSQNAKSRSIH